MAEQSEPQWTRQYAYGLERRVVLERRAAERERTWHRLNGSADEHVEAYRPAPSRSKNGKGKGSSAYEGVVDKGVEAVVAKFVEGDPSELMDYEGGPHEGVVDKGMDYETDVTGVLVHSYAGEYKAMSKEDLVKKAVEITDVSLQKCQYFYLESEVEEEPGTLDEFWDDEPQISSSPCLQQSKAHHVTKFARLAF